MSEIVTIRNVGKRAVIVGAHFLLPGHHVDVERIVADEAWARHPGDLAVTSESGFVESTIQLAEAGAVLAVEPYDNVDVPSEMAVVSPENQAIAAQPPQAAAEEPEHVDSTQRLGAAARKRRAGAGRDA